MRQPLYTVKIQGGTDKRRWLTVLTTDDWNKASEELDAWADQEYRVRILRRGRIVAYTAWNRKAT